MTQLLKLLGFLCCRPDRLCAATQIGSALPSRFATRATSISNDPTAAPRSMTCCQSPRRQVLRPTDSPTGGHLPMRESTAQENNPASGRQCGRADPPEDSGSGHGTNALGGCQSRIAAGVRARCSTFTALSAAGSAPPRACARGHPRQHWDGNRRPGPFRHVHRLGRRGSPLPPGRVRSHSTLRTRAPSTP
jgi:hypothetical protein